MKEYGCVGTVGSDEVLVKVKAKARRDSIVDYDIQLRSCSSRSCLPIDTSMVSVDVPLLAGDLD